MEAETASIHHSLERPRSGAGSVPELFPLPRQTFRGFEQGDGVWFGWSEGKFRIMGESRLLGGKKPHEFPLTEEGWIAAWQMMSSQYPQLAEKVSAHVAKVDRASAEPEVPGGADLAKAPYMDRDQSAPTGD